MPRPQPAEYGNFYKGYIDNTTGEDVVEVIENSIAPLQAFLDAIPEEKADYAYALDKWTVKQLIQHTIDTERIFAYRALCIARGEKQALPGFEEKDYAANAPAQDRSLQSLISECMLVRQSTLILFLHFDKPALMRKGVASNNPITPNALGFLIVGHTLHHQNILRERYAV